MRKRRGSDDESDFEDNSRRKKKADAAKDKKEKRAKANARKPLQPVSTNAAAAADDDRPPLDPEKPPVPRAGLAKPFKVPSLLGSTFGGGLKKGSQLGVRRKPALTTGPAHDPEAADAIILYHPKNLTDLELMELSKSTTLHGAKPKQEVHVVIDPILAKVLRKHQVEGVKFLYECTTGVKVENAFGCIMADEMQLCACYSSNSLVKNWANELVKWLGAQRIHPLTYDNKGTKEQNTKDLEHFVSSKGRAITQSVLIISYESLRTSVDILSKTEIGLMLCDEGHRLKNANSLTYQSLNSLNSKRRNDLTEYYSLLSFAIPGVLGTEADFRKNFENPILKGRDAMASAKEKEGSEAKLQELLQIANKFIIRRTAEILTKFHGQKKVCFIYRFIATGSIEEKIFQRQAHKQSLSSCVVDEEVDVERHFTLESLRQLFQLNEETQCDTHDTFRCKRCMKGRQMIKPAKVATGATGSDTSNWNHFSECELHKAHDSIIREIASERKDISFLFENKSHDA
ncbi:DNA-dependent ATPase protein rad54 [Irineochytrium annulatum]|nr:DNA-dependent ATPase protein rad54 [Irineochytrium annulatum]